MENCADVRSDKPEDACLCYCATCRIVYAIYMLGRAVLTAPHTKIGDHLKDDEVDILQTHITKAWD